MEKNISIGVGSFIEPNHIEIASANNSKNENNSLNDNKLTDTLPPPAISLSSSTTQFFLSSWPTIGRGHFSLILLAELSYEIVETFIVHLPIIFHLIFLGFDSLQPPVYEHSRILLLNLVHYQKNKIEKLFNSGKSNFLNIQKSIKFKGQNSKLLFLYNECLDLEYFLQSKEGKPLWKNEDITINTIKDNLSSIKELQMLVVRIINIFSCDEQNASLNEKWADEGY